MLHIMHCMVSVQQANLSECEGPKTSVTMSFFAQSLSLIWDSHVMLNSLMVAQSPYYILNTKHLSAIRIHFDFFSSDKFRMTILKFLERIMCVRISRVKLSCVTIPHGVKL